jgi:SWI/SNF-related matrix-associated actin-dependent regulator 1 of chromatin subfamily A
MSLLAIDDDHLLLDFPYDAEQVAEVKKIKGAKWDKVSRVWRAPLTSLAEVRDFALKHRFEIDAEVLLFTLPDHHNERRNDGVSLDGEWLYVSFGYDPVMVRSVKQIAGITWHAKTKAWRAPMTSIREVVKWGETFKKPISAEVRNRLSDTENSLSQLKEASYQTDADIDIPELHGTLLPYQKAGVAYAVKARQTFIADEMGLGKTLQAISTLEMANREAPSYPAVVVCPATLVLNWRAEYARWLPHRRVAVVTDRKNFPTDYDVVVVGYSNVTTWEKQLSSHKSYVFDESHYCKTPTAQRTKSAVKIAKSAPTNGVVLCLTGTPVTNRPAEYASQLKILGKIDKFGGEWGFYRRYCDAYKDKWGQWHLEGHSNLDELNERLRSICYIRRTKKQVLTELPPVLHDPVLVDGTAAGMKEYKKAEADIVKYLVERAKEIALELGLSPHSAAVQAKIRAESNQHLVRLSVLRRLAARAKMPVIQEWVESRLAEGRKVVIAAHHRDIVDELARLYGNLRIQGGMDINDIEEQKKKFMELSVEEAPVIVLSIQAAKTGHNLQVAQDVLFVELPWTPADVDQTYSRCHRLGQKSSVTATYLLASGTIDEDIYSLIERKRNVVNQAVEGELSEQESASDLIMKLLDNADY